jgi:hypothetical protein
MMFEFSEGYEDVEDPPFDDMETPLDDTEPLLDGSEEIHKQDDKTSTVTIPQLLVSRHLQKPLIIISFAMLSQQLSGEFHAYRIRLFDHYNFIQASTQVSYHPGHQSHRSHLLARDSALLQQRDSFQVIARPWTLCIARDHNHQCPDDISACSAYRGKS